MSSAQLCVRCVPPLRGRGGVAPEGTEFQPPPGGSSRGGNASSPDSGRPRRCTALRCGPRLIPVSHSVGRPQPRPIRGGRAYQSTPLTSFAEQRPRSARPPLSPLRASTPFRSASPSPGGGGSRAAGARGEVISHGRSRSNPSGCWRRRNGWRAARYFTPFVPAQAGTQEPSEAPGFPASAGMNGGSG